MFRTAAKSLKPRERPIILYFQQNSAFGASEAYLFDLAANADRSCFDIQLVHPDIPELSEFSTLQDQGVRLRPVPSAMYSRHIWQILPFWIRFFRTLKPTLVHFNDPCPVGVLAASLAGVPIKIITHHTPELIRNYNLLGRFVEILAFRVCDAVIFTSEPSREKGILQDNIAPERSTVVPLGLRPEWFGAVDAVDRTAIRSRLAIPNDAIMILNPARLGSQKRQDILIEAARIVTVSSDRTVFLIAGEGELREEIEHKVQSVGLHDQFRLLGYRSDIIDLISAADIVVMSSDFEGLCYALIEAAARQIPAVATNVGGVRYSVVAGQTGLLVPPGDPDALASALLSLINNPAQRSIFGIAARQRAEQLFTLERMIADTQKLYATLLSDQSDSVN